MSQQLRVLLFGLSLMTITAVARADPTFPCGVEEVLSARLSPTDEIVDARIVFITFAGITDDLPWWADSLEAQLPRFIETMSRGRQRMNLEIVRVPDDPTKAWFYPLLDSTGLGGSVYHGVNSIMVQIIADSIADVWDGVEFVFMLHYMPTLGCTNDSTLLKCTDTASPKTSADSHMKSSPAIGYCGA